MRGGRLFLHYLDNYICGAAKIFDIFLAAILKGTCVHKLADPFLPFCSISLLWTKKKKKILLRAASHYFSITFFALFKNNKVRSCFRLVCVVYLYLLTHLVDLHPQSVILFYFFIIIIIIIG